MMLLTIRMKYSTLIFEKYIFLDLVFGSATVSKYVHICAILFSIYVYKCPLCA